jgi:hypothetical protein
MATVAKPVKKVVTIKAIEEDSATPQEVNDELSAVNEVAGTGDSLRYDDIINQEVPKWDEGEEEPEVNAGAEEGEQDPLSSANEGEEPEDEAGETSVEEEKEPKKPKKDDDLIKDDDSPGVVKRLSKERERSNKEKAKLQNTIKELNKRLAQDVPHTPLSGDEDARIEKLEAKLVSLDKELEEGEDTLSSGQTLRIDRKYRKIEDEIKEIKETVKANKRSKAVSDAVRKESEEQAYEAYNFLNDKKSVEYKIFANEMYPMLKSLIPGFVDHPHDIAIAAEFAETLSDARKFRALTTKEPEDEEGKKEYKTEKTSPPVKKKKGKETNMEFRKQLRSGKITHAEFAMKTMPGMFKRSD